MSSRREVLADLPYQPDYHAGLWLNRYISAQERESKESRHDFVNEVAGIHESPLYDPFFQRWYAALPQADPVPLVAEARVDGRMIVGMGTESVLETAISLHRTYGVPYIPGSALKGLAASYVRHYHYVHDAQWGTWEQKTNDKGEPVWFWKPEHYYNVLFGNTDSAGYITFFDALYVPGSGHNGAALWPDVITVHHEGYYQDSMKPPADWDSPTPVPFLSATGRYLIAVSGPSGWAEATMKLLRLALKEIGVGAKTSSGYGRLTLDSEQPATAYKLQQQPDAGASPPPDHIEPRLPTIGEKFRGKIDDIDDELGVVLLKLPDSFEDAAGKTIPISPALRRQTLVVIPRQHKTGGGYRSGNMRWVEVIAVRKEGKIVEVKPITKDAQS